MNRPHSKTLDQIAYEAFAPGGVPFSSLPILARATWHAVALAVEREVVARIASVQAEERKRHSETVQCRCGARHMKGESHICNDDPALVAKLAGR